MIYQMLQASQDLLNPMRRMARGSGGILAHMDMPHPAFFPIRQMRAAMEMFGEPRISHARPDFAIGPVRVGNRLVEVEQEVVAPRPSPACCTSEKDVDIRLPRVLVVAPMSGHFATLLRNTVQACCRTTTSTSPTGTMRATCRSAPGASGSTSSPSISCGSCRDGPRRACAGGLPAVVAVLAAVALMAEDRDPCSPRSMSLLAGPIDTRVKPTKVNELAQSKPIEWFEKNLIATVPWRHKGGGRSVYPGAVQLTAFMAMNMERHVKAHHTQFWNCDDGEAAKAEMTGASTRNISPSWTCRRISTSRRCGRCSRSMPCRSAS